MSADDCQNAISKWIKNNNQALSLRSYRFKQLFKQFERERTKRRGREEPQVPLSQVPRGLGVRFRAQVYKTSSYADYQVLPIECLACKAAKRP